MRTYSAVIERDPDTGLYVGYIPGWPGAHSQGATLEELNQNLHEVVEMLLEDSVAMITVSRITSLPADRRRASSRFPSRIN
jgi:predicted RNase H-like HicB family nuclease